MSPGRDQDYLCEGLAEELINALTHIDGLRVAARTASFQFRGAGADVRAVGRQLGVGTLLEGSVRKADDRLRVTVQLIEVATGYHRWSQRFDRTLDDVFAIQDEIAESVATSLRGSVLSRREKQALLRPQTGAAAYEYYLRGRQHLPRMTQPDLETKPRDVRARDRAGCRLRSRVGRAWRWCTPRCTSGSAREKTTWPGRNAPARRALELAPDLAEAHVARGFALSLSRRYDEAAREFEDAIRLNPNLFDAYYYFARTSFARGDIERSAELFRKAADVRQEDFQSPMLLAQSLRMLGRTEEAKEAGREGIRRAEHILALNPLDGRALSLGSVALFDDGQTARAIEWSQRSLELYPDDMSTLINAACLHCERRSEGRSAGVARARVRARLGEARLGRARSRLRHPARRPAVQEDAGEAENSRNFGRPARAERVLDPVLPRAADYSGLFPTGSAGLLFNLSARRSRASASGDGHIVLHVVDRRNAPTRLRRCPV